MRKILSAFILAACMSVPCQAASIVASIFPAYDGVREITKGVSHDLTLLLDNGADLHSWQPSAEDIVRISECDLFVYVGGESDTWAEGVLKVPAQNGRQVINLLDVLGSSVKPEKIVEGMQHEHEHDNSHGHEAHAHEHEELDEHIWLSLRNAEIICRKISDTLSEIDPANKNIYAANFKDYAGQLAILDGEYSEMVRHSARRVMLFADRFPFRYLADNYGLEYYAAFSGCSAESEASFETIIFLAKKLDELQLPCVIKIDGANHKIAETVINASKNNDRKIITLDSMQSSGLKDIESGKTYLTTMRDNLTALKEALN